MIARRPTQHHNTGISVVVAFECVDVSHLQTNIARVEQHATVMREHQQFKPMLIKYSIRKTQLTEHSCTPATKEYIHYFNQQLHDPLLPCYSTVFLIEINAKEKKYAKQYTISVIVFFRTKSWGFHSQKNDIHYCN